MISTFIITFNKEPFTAAYKLNDFCTVTLHKN